MRGSAWLWIVLLGGCTSARLVQRDAGSAGADVGPETDVGLDTTDADPIADAATNPDSDGGRELDATVPSPACGVPEGFECAEGVCTDAPDRAFGTSSPGSGHWSYGFVGGADGAYARGDFRPMVQLQTAELAGGATLLTWTPDDALPAVAFNVSDVEGRYNLTVYPPRALLLHPDGWNPGPERAVLRWIAPRTCVYEVSVRASGLDPGTNTQIDLVVLGSRPPSVSRSVMATGMTATRFDLTTELSAGDGFDLTVGQNGGAEADSTRLEVTVTVR